MKRQHLLALVIVAVVLAAAGVVYQIVRSQSWNNASADRRVLPDLPVNNVAIISVKTGAKTLTLKNDQGTWRVMERHGYPADFQKIRDLLRSLWEMKAGQVTHIGASQHVRLQIVQPGSAPAAGTGTEIDLTSASNQLLGSLVIGKAMEQSGESGPAGRFVFNPKQGDQVDLVADSFSSIDPLVVGPWLDKTFFSADNLKQVTQTGLNDSWTLSRSDPKADWKLENAGPSDSLNKEFTANLTNFNPSFTDVRAVDTPPSETGLGQPITVDLKTFDGFEYKLLLGKEGPENTRYLRVNVSAQFPEQPPPEPNEKPEDKAKKDKAFAENLAKLKERVAHEQQLQSWIYLVSDWSLEPFLKRRNEIIGHPSPSPAAAAAPAVPR